MSSKLRQDTRNIVPSSLSYEICPILNLFLCSFDDFDLIAGGHMTYMDRAVIE